MNRVSFSLTVVSVSSQDCQLLLNVAARQRLKMLIPLASTIDYGLPAAVLRVCQILSTITLLNKTRSEFHRLRRDSSKEYITDESRKTSGINGMRPEFERVIPLTRCLFSCNMEWSQTTEPQRFYISSEVNYKLASLSLLRQGRVTGVSTINKCHLRPWKFKCGRSRYSGCCRSRPQYRDSSYLALFSHCSVGFVRYAPLHKKERLAYLSLCPTENHRIQVVLYGSSIDTWCSYSKIRAKLEAAMVHMLQ